MRNTIVTVDPNPRPHVGLVLSDTCECSMTIDMTEKDMNFSSPVQSFLSTHSLVEKIFPICGTFNYPVQMYVYVDS